MNTGLAILFQIVGSFLFAGGATLQHLAVEGRDGAAGQSGGRLSFGGLVRLFFVPRWLAGLSLIAVGAGMQLFALTMAPVTVVQPVGILAVPWAVLLAAKVYHHTIAGLTWAAVGITIAGVTGFTIISTSYTTGDTDFDFWAIPAAFAVACLVGAVLALAARRARSWGRPILWSSVGAVFYGLATGMMKSAIHLIHRHGLFPIHWQVYVTLALILVCYVLGVWMIQQGYASGPAEITVGTMTTVDPLAAVLFGLIVLGEGAGMGLVPAVAMGGFGAVAVLGVVLLSKGHPEALHRQGPSEPSPDDAGA